MGEVFGRGEAHLHPLGSPSLPGCFLSGLPLLCPASQNRTGAEAGQQAQGPTLGNTSQKGVLGDVPGGAFCLTLGLGGGRAEPPCWKTAVVIGHEKRDAGRFLSLLVGQLGTLVPGPDWVPSSWWEETKAGRLVRILPVSDGGWT